MTSHFRKSLVWTCGVLGVLAVSSGCARYQPQPISPVRTAAALESRSLDDPRLRKFVEANLHSAVRWPATSWNFDTLTLAAFYYHPDLDLARARLALTHGQVITAGQYPNPVISAVPGLDTTVHTPSSWIPYVNVDIPIVTANKIGYRVEVAEHAERSAKLNIAATAWQVRGRLHAAVLQLYAVEQIRAALRKEEAARSAIVGYVEGQKGTGLVSMLDVSQARIGLTRVHLSGLDLERQEDDARATIAAAVGLPAQALQSVQIQFVAPNAQPQSRTWLSEMRRAALRRRADVQAALADYEASQSALQLEIAKQYPDVHLGPGYQYDQGENKYSVGATLELPLLNQNQGPIAEAAARRTLAGMTLLSVQSRVIAEIDAATTRFDASQRKAEATHRLLADFEGNRQAAQRLFDAGDLSKFELMTLNVELQVDEQAAVAVDVQVIQALGALEDALQDPFAIAEPCLAGLQRDPVTTEVTAR